MPEPAKKDLGQLGHRTKREFLRTEIHRTGGDRSLNLSNDPAFLPSRNDPNKEQALASNRSLFPAIGKQQESVFAASSQPLHSLDAAAPKQNLQLSARQPQTSEFRPARMPLGHASFRARYGLVEPEEPMSPQSAQKHWEQQCKKIDHEIRKLTNTYKSKESISFYDKQFQNHNSLSNVRDALLRSNDARKQSYGANLKKKLQAMAPARAAQGSPMMVPAKSPAPSPTRATIVKLSKAATVAKLENRKLQTLHRNQSVVPKINLSKFPEFKLDNHLQARVPSAYLDDTEGKIPVKQMEQEQIRAYKRGLKA